MVKQYALEVGFDLVGIAPPAALKDLEFLPRWLKKGYGGEMRYLSDPRREDPVKVLPSVKSIICVGLIYNTPHSYSSDNSTRGGGKYGFDNAAPGKMPPRAWISRYSWGRDYHGVMRKRLEQLRAVLNEAAPGVETRVYVDTGPIVERAFARLSGMGWMGKNTCLINEGKGSWFFLGVVLTNLELELDFPAPDRCGSCTRCLEACPTGALVEPYVMDASRCISYFNIELRGSIPEEFREAIGRNVFGCDICQDVCPWNGPSSKASGAFPDEAGRHEDPCPPVSPRRYAAVTKLPEFQPMQIEVYARNSALAPCDSAQSQASIAEPRLPPVSFSLFDPSLKNLLSIAEKDFQRVFARSPIKRAKFRGWLRNLCVVLGNSGDRQFIPWLETAAQHVDPLVREHANWALRRLQGSDHRNP